MISPLIEYLLATGRAGGGKLVKYGVSVVTVPIWPAGLNITFNTLPRHNAYANIQYSQSISPSMVPDAFYIESYQAGMILQIGNITENYFGLHYTWIEFLINSPITTIIRNISGLNQYFEIGQEFLVIDSEEDYKKVRKIIDEWNRVYRVKEGGE